MQELEADFSGLGNLRCSDSLLAGADGDVCLRCRN
jgi:hypothetical protein